MSLIKMRLNKRSALELSFNFIFAMIAAVVIFSIALAIINSVMKTANLEKSLAVTNKISDAFSSNLLEGGKSDIIQLSSSISFSSDCDGISFGENVVSTLNYPLFSAKKIKTNTLGITTKKLLLPNYISNSVYLYAPTKIYLYCEDCDEISKTPIIYFGLMQTIASAEITADTKMIEAEIIGSGYSLSNEELNTLKKSNVIVVYPNNEDPPDVWCTRFQCKSILISKEDQTGQSNNQELYSKLSYTSTSDYPLGRITYDGDNFYFLGKEMLFGALISDDLSLYNCNLNKILSSVLRTTTISLKRLEIFEGEGGAFSTDGKCKEIYSNSTKTYEDLSEVIDSLIPLIDENPNSVNINLLEELRKNILLISELNYNATRYSCPSIY
jgi:hypothetical protein